MSAGLRANILTALEQVCRRRFNSPNSLLLDKWVDCDDKAVRYGASTREIASEARLCTLAQVRRVLHEEARHGAVLIEKSGVTSIRWWPEGMLAKLIAERVSAGAPP
jgi:hypothetical protein